MAESERLRIVAVDRYRAFLRVFIHNGTWDFPPDYAPELTSDNCKNYVLELTRLGNGKYQAIIAGAKP